MGKPLRILYVDDDKDIRQIVRLALSLDPGIELRLAGDGEEALTMLAEDPWRPELVMLDVMMPRIDGPTTMARMRAEQGLTAVPYLFVTARGREADQRSYAEAGATAVIVKPFDPITLAAQVRAVADRAA